MSYAVKYIPYDARAHTIHYTYGSPLTGKKVHTVLPIYNNKMLFMYKYSDQKLL